jgi:hypothetical protein
MKSAVSEQDPIEPTQLAHHLAEVLDFRLEQGIIRLHEQPVILLSAAAMGLLRKELINTLDLETARRLFLRFAMPTGITTPSVCATGGSGRIDSRGCGPASCCTDLPVSHGLKYFTWNTKPNPAAFLEK